MAILTSLLIASTLGISAMSSRIPPFAETHQPFSNGGTQAKRQKGRSHRGKEEAEGTQAPNRFEADITIKSKYELNGQPLEVDTD